MHGRCEDGPPTLRPYVTGFFQGNEVTLHAAVRQGRGQQEGLEHMRLGVRRARASHLQRSAPAETTAPAMFSHCLHRPFMGLSGSRPVCGRGCCRAVVTSSAHGMLAT